MPSPPRVSWHDWVADFLPKQLFKVCQNIFQPFPKCSEPGTWGQKIPKDMFEHSKSRKSEVWSTRLSGIRLQLRRASEKLSKKARHNLDTKYKKPQGIGIIGRLVLGLASWRVGLILFISHRSDPRSRGWNNVAVNFEDQKASGGEDSFKGSVKHADRWGTKKKKQKNKKKKQKNKNNNNNNRRRRRIRRIWKKNMKEE